MKLTYIDGCTCTSWSVDNKDWDDYSLEQKKQICHRLIDSVDNEYIMQQLFTLILENEGEYTDLGQCETCGDWVSKYELEIQ